MSLTLRPRPFALRGVSPMSPWKPWPALAVGLLTLAVAVAAAQNPAEKPPAGDKKPDQDPKKAEGVLAIPAVQGGEKVTLRGKQKKVVIDAVTGAGEVDVADDFEAEEITIGSIDGAGRVVLKSANKKGLKRLVVGVIEGAGTLDS